MVIVILVVIIEILIVVLLIFIVITIVIVVLIEQKEDLIHFSQTSCQVGSARERYLARKNKPATK